MLIAGALALAAPAAADELDRRQLRDQASQLFGALPEEVPPEDYEITPARIDLGRKLYYETRISKSGTISCNSCHMLDAFGVDNEPTSPGHEGVRGERNAPTVYNAALHVAQFWDGRASTLEEQAKGPILNPVEMGMPASADVLGVLKGIPGYAPLFAAAFPDAEEPFTYDHVARAIGAFERRLMTPGPLDDFIRGDLEAMSEEQLRGMQTFVTAGCTTCHNGPAVGGRMFQKIGLVNPYETEDTGRYAVTGEESDRYVFKVPSLRNVAETGPYFHDGSIAALDEAVRRMGWHQLGKKLSDAEVAAIITFLEALTGRSRHTPRGPARVGSGAAQELPSRAPETRPARTGETAPGHRSCYAGPWLDAPRPDVQPRPDPESDPPFDACLQARGPEADRYGRILAHLEEIGPEGAARLREEAEISLRNQGITFTVYADAEGTERIFPFDPVPRILSGDAWARLEAGIVQRLRAVQLFVADLYGRQRILRDRVVPTALVTCSPFFCREMSGRRPPGDVWVHVAGVDLIQDEAGRFLVLEDNLRVPSGVSYVLENRRVSARVLPDLLARSGVRNVDHYPQILLDALRSLGPEEEPRVAVLTPGIANSAYFEHSFLAAEMGVPLVQGQDLVVDRDVLYARTTAGLSRVDVLYRRIDDDFLDPVVFRPDSVLGVPGLMHAVRAGNLALANAPGTGVVDDKAMYAYLPRVIRYYLDEDPILPQVPTWLCREPPSRDHVLDHLEDLVLKPVDGSGGYGVLIGPHATRAQLAAAREAVRRRPEGFVAQPVQRLATLPTLVAEDDALPHLEPRHVDLRPFAVTGRDGEARVLPGGLTRVALRRGNLVVNSSQGGGSKDTWVLFDGEVGHG